MAEESETSPGKSQRTFVPDPFGLFEFLSDGKLSDPFMARIRRLLRQKLLDLTEKLED